MMSDIQARSWDFGRSRAGFAWSSQKARAKLLLQHGYGEYSQRYVRHYAQLIPKLNASGFDVFAFDLEGHGQSPGKRGMTDINRAAEDHLCARRALACDGSPLFLFGHSLGGLVTAASVGRDQSGVSGVVLSAPALLFEIHPALELTAGVIAALLPSARLTQPIAPEGLSDIAEEIEAYRQDPEICHKAPPARLGASALSVAREVLRTCKDWQVPVLLLHGKRDMATSPRGSERFFSETGSKDRELRIFPEGKHELLNDIGRDEVLQLILDWLGRRAG